MIFEFYNIIIELSEEDKLFKIEHDKKSNNTKRAKSGIK